MSVVNVSPCESMSVDAIKFIDIEENTPSTRSNITTLAMPVDAQTMPVDDKVGLHSLLIIEVLALFKI